MEPTPYSPFGKMDPLPPVTLTKNGLKPGPNPKQSLVDIYIRPVRRQTRDNFKAACAKRGETMKSVLLRFINDYIRNTEAGKLNITDKPKKGKRK